MSDLLFARGEPIPEDANTYSYELLSDEDIRDLGRIIVASVEPPAFHKAGYGLKPAGHAALRILGRRGVDITFDSTTGKVR